MHVRPAASEPGAANSCRGSTVFREIRRSRDLSGLPGLMKMLMISGFVPCAAETLSSRPLLLQDIPVNIGKHTKKF